MKKSVPAANPEVHVGASGGWQHEMVTVLREEVIESSAVDEAIKWCHLVYFANGPAVLIRAEEERVLFGFWRGRRLREIEPRLKPGGRYEMATIELREGDEVRQERVRKWVREAVALNHQLGDPTAGVRRGG